MTHILLPFYEPEAADNWAELGGIVTTAINCRCPHCNTYLNRYSYDDLMFAMAMSKLAKEEPAKFVEAFLFDWDTEAFVRLFASLGWCDLGV